MSFNKFGTAVNPPPITKLNMHKWVTCHPHIEWNVYIFHILNGTTRIEIHRPALGCIMCLFFPLHYSNSFRYRGRQAYSSNNIHRACPPHYYVVHPSSLSMESGKHLNFVSGVCHLLGAVASVKGNDLFIHAIECRNVYKYKKKTRDTCELA